MLVWVFFGFVMGCVSVSVQFGFGFECSSTVRAGNLIRLHTFYGHILRGGGSESVGLMRFFVSHDSTPLTTAKLANFFTLFTIQISF